MSDTITISTSAPDSVDQAEYHALTHGAALYIRPTAGVLRLTDGDRQDFLQRMTTNNIAILRPGQSAVTVLTSPTARALYVFTVVARADDLLLLPAPGQSQALARHLRGQIFFMDKVKVQDINDQWARLRMMGPKAAELLKALNVAADTLAPNAATIQDSLVVVCQTNYEVPGFEVAYPIEKQDEIVSALIAAGATHISDTTYEARRVELGRPASGTELSEDTSPLEAGLGWACAENKGCYTGQEIIARQITYDKVTKTLVGVRLQEGVVPGSNITIDNRSVGTITSVAYSPTLSAPIALAIVKRPHNSPDTAVQVGEQDAIIVALPFIGG